MSEAPDATAEVLVVQRRGKRRQRASTPVPNARAIAGDAAPSDLTQSASAATAPDASSSSAEIAAPAASRATAGASRGDSASPQAQPEAKRLKFDDSPRTPVRRDAPAVAPLLAHDGAAALAPAHDDAAVLAPADTPVEAAAAPVAGAREETAARDGAAEVPPGDAAVLTPGDGRGVVPVLSPAGDVAAPVANTVHSADAAKPPDILCQ